MASDGWFRKRSKFSTDVAGEVAKAVPDGVATKCTRCGQILFTRDFEKNLKVCPQCGFHHRLSADERLAYTADDGSFVPFAENLAAADPLAFPDYKVKLDKGLRVTGSSSGMRVGTARVRGVQCILCVADFGFVGGSMGSVEGEVLVRALETGMERALPVVVFTASGGARMQEGLIALMQMAKTSAAVAAFARRRLPYIVVMTDPTIGGVLASYASLGDVILAEPGALIGFAGARVAAQVSVQKPPDGYQTAEWALSRGQIDQVVHRRDLPETISSLLMMLGSHAGRPLDPVQRISGEMLTEAVVG
jgi:acetyl-CoA carboxylase carboxyl transferase subunit beta